MSNLLRGYMTFTSIWTIYGFTRGYRAEPHHTPHHVPPHFTERFTNGFMNSMVYSNPIAQVMSVSELVYRLHVHCCQFDKQKYKLPYYEIVGMCRDTI